MSAPTVSASLDKTSYAPGETMTLTVLYGDPDRASLVITTTVQDSTGATATATTTAVIDPGSVSVSSTPARSWNKVSDNGSVAVLTAVA